MQRRRNGHSIKTAEDAYYDGEIDPRYEGFCEETGTKFTYKQDDGWDSYEELEEDEEY
jgi:hypothetical protein